MNKELNKAPVEQAGGDERVIGWRERILAAHPNSDPGFWPDALLVEHMAAEIADLRAALAQPSPAQSDASFEEWLANELEGEDGQPVPAAVCDIALARRAFNHWPKLEKPAQVGGVRFSAGVSSRLVVEAAQRLYEFESTPEQEAERIERLQAFREQLDPLNLAPHAKAFNEAPAEALKPEQAEAERPEVVAYRTVGRHAKHQHPHFALNYYKQNAEDQAAHWRERGCEVSEEELMTVAQHERIVKAWIERWKAYIELSAKIAAQRDAALARVAELGANLGAALGLLRESRGFVDRDNPLNESGQIKLLEEIDAFLNSPVAQAQHSVPRAWLDVQAERRRQITVEGYHGFRDSHYINYELSKAARAYIEVSWHALSGGLPCKKPESWPWMAGFKWSDGRTMLVKACALTLAEIERLDRAAAPGKEG